LFSHQHKDAGHAQSSASPSTAFMK
jgi:hypothetical protein